MDAAVTLARPDARVGENVTVRVTITNNRNAQIVLLDNSPSCSVYATATYAPQSVPPTQLTGRRAAFRSKVLPARPQASSITLEPDVACKRGFLPMKPGERITRTFTWKADSENGVAYDDNVALTVGVFWDQDYTQSTRPVTVRLHLSGGDPNRLTYARALDLALADPRFGAAVDRAAEPVRGGVGFSDGKYALSVLLAAPQGVYAYAQMDGSSGQITSYVESPPGSN